ncbi:MAG: DUF423 domain-containing protein [Hyphomonadaceae bacterium]|nr:DUF423 domain-containing protein [Hyphomonadaceae bacterium]
MKLIGPTAFFGAISGFACVAIGAFGAHALKDAQAKEWVEIGFRYHALHTMASFASISFRNWGAPLARYTPPFFFGGIILFSGSLYLMALGAPRWFGAITPIGGLCFLIGWAILAKAGLDLYRMSLNNASEDASP